MSFDPQSFIQSMIEAQLVIEHDHHKSPARPVIALSRDYGSGGTEVASLLAERLGVQVYDRELLDAISNHARVDAHLMERLDERISHHRDHWIRSLITGENISQSAYRHHLINVLLGLLPKGGVVMGRGAHIVLANRPVFRVRVIGSELECAERVARREEIPFEEAEELVRKINHERAQFVWELFHRRLAEAHRFDLVINTDRIDNLNHVADLIIQTMGHTRSQQQEVGR